MAATLTLPFAAAEPWPAMLDDLRREGVEIVALTPSGEEDLNGVPRVPRIAILAGHEGRGLSEAGLRRADRRVRIPMKPGADSLNVVTAVAIALHALRQP
jgi:tRNA G18 (ribose-2'-O)-methylase SpoU